MISLFIDTSMANVSISVVKDGKMLSLIEKNIPNMHSSYATKYVKDALDMANIDANDVDNILWSENSIKTILIFLLIYIFVIIFYESSKRNYRRKN